MKKILLFLAVLPGVAFGQTQPPTQVFAGQLYEYKNALKVDKVFLLPRGDTAGLPASLLAPGAIIFRTADQFYYGFDGNQWGRISGDTSSLSARINSKVSISDTASMLSPYLRKRDTASLSTRINLAIPLAQKAVANGVATLGLDGRVPATQLPTGSQMYKGTWDASTNTPTLADGTGTAGWTYRVIGDTATRDLGSGNITFAPGDDVIYDGTAWQKVPSSNAVNSVNGKTGTVVIDQTDVGLGNVDNTTDLGKPISTATQTALNAKANSSVTITAGTGLTGGGNLTANRTIAIDPAYASFTNYYTKTNLQTSGQASVHFGNLTNKPTTLSGYGITDAAPSNIGLPGVLANANTANADIKLGGSGVTTQRALSVTRSISGNDYTGTFAIGAGGGTYMGTVQGTSSKLIYLRASQNYPEYSPDGTTLYPIWHAGSHPTTLSGYGITDAIQNQNSTDQTAAFRQTGTGILGSVNTTANTGNADVQLHVGSYGNGTQNRRWSIFKSTTEASGNVGNDLSIGRYDNSGTFLSSPLKISRATGVITMDAGFSAKYGSSIAGTGTGTSSLSYLLFNDASGSLRGTVGKVNSTLNDFQVTSPYSIALVPNGVVSTAPPFLLSSTDLKLTTSTLQMNGASATISSGPSLSYDVASGEYHRFKVNGSEKVTISQEGILSVGNSSPSSIRASPFQVEGNGWSTDAWILGTGNSPTAEFGLSGSGVNGSAFVRTMGTGDLTFQTSANQVRARVNGTTGYFEVPLTMKAGAVDVNGNAAISGSGVASFSSVTAPAINSTSTLHVAAVYTKTRTISGNGTIASDDYTILLASPSGTGGSYTLTLPDPSSYEGRELEFWAGSGLGSWTTNYAITVIAGPPTSTINGGEKIKALGGEWRMLYKSDY